MRLTDLDPQFVQYLPGGNHGRVYMLASAQGVRFDCPLGCGHWVLCWFREKGVPDEATPKPGRWGVSGTGYADLTLTPSVHLSATDANGKPIGCGWHGFVTGGIVT